MDKKLGILNIVLVVSLFLMSAFIYCPIVNADSINNNNNNTDNSVELTIPLPFSSHIANQIIDERNYVNNILPFP
jgi:hypothetical protein